jgi:hypothetical protein
MLTVFIGNNDQELADAALSHDQSAYLIDQTNLKNNHTGTVYVSLADLSGISQLNELLRTANIIFYVPSNKWVDQNKKHSQKYWTERSIKIFSLDKTKTIVNFPSEDTLINKNLMLDLADVRKTSNKQLWVAGCSITHGVGVDANQTYASILSKKLKIEFSLLAVPGSSIMWAADQILRSDIRTDDIVIWGLTSVDRFPYFCPINNLVLHINSGYYTINPKFNDTVDIKHVNDIAIEYRALTAIYQVINYCNKIGAKLIIAGIHTDFKFAANLKDLTNYIHLNNFYGANLDDSYIDYGIDNIHPGPLMHQWYAENILGKLK